MARLRKMPTGPHRVRLWPGRVVRQTGDEASISGEDAAGPMAPRHAVVELRDITRSDDLSCARGEELDRFRRRVGDSREPTHEGFCGVERYHADVRWRTVLQRIERNIRWKVKSLSQPRKFTRCGQRSNLSAAGMKENSLGEFPRRHDQPIRTGRRARGFR